MNDKLRRLNERLNSARHANNIAAADEITRTHRMYEKHEKEVDPLEIPMNQLEKVDNTKGPTSEDHFQDPDVAIYHREINKIKPIVYSQYQERKHLKTPFGKDWKPSEELQELQARRAIKKTEQLRKRNERDRNYDNTGSASVDFINDNNRRFNKRLARDFNEFTKDLRYN